MRYVYPALEDESAGAVSPALTVSITFSSPISLLTGPELGGNEMKDGKDER